MWPPSGQPSGTSMSRVRMPKATPTVARLRPTAIAASGQRAQDQDQDEEGGDGDRGDDDRDPLPGHVAVVVERARGRRATPVVDAGFAAERRRVVVRAVLLSAIEPGELKRVAGEDEQRRRLAAVVEVDRLRRRGRAAAARRRRGRRGRSSRSRRGRACGGAGGRPAVPASALVETMRTMARRRPACSG